MNAGGRRRRLRAPPRAAGQADRARVLRPRDGAGRARLPERRIRALDQETGLAVGLAQQFGDLAIAIAAVLPSKLDNIGGETLLVLTTARDLALCRAMLPERRTGATLGDMQL